ncbi:hypothetical protein [Rubrivivax gelatinosus]|uniref:hypothetical protein n=1 Tax=Rubrivivax gelatinosus TaxID=28068 RepID=UPI0009DA199E|nr:hypothetical protein [Rubrivivax gelatinosus]MBG6083116.1 hypothetical protein [Rubrivivax gelatinosus]
MNLQQKPAPLLACTASGMPFSEWRRRPVYSVHCKTFAVARALCGVELAPGHSVASLLGVADQEGLWTFRALRPFRAPQANSLRVEVARAIRAQRRALVSTR